MSKERRPWGYWTKEKVIEELHRIAKELGHSPTCREAGNLIYYEARRLFGSFNNAKRAANLDTNPSKFIKIRKT